jgi:hypothetical protein
MLKTKSALKHFRNSLKLTPHQNTKANPFLLLAFVLAVWSSIAYGQTPASPDQHTVGIFQSNGDGIYTNADIVYGPSHICEGENLQFGFTDYEATDYPTTPNPVGITKRIRWFVSGPNGTQQITGAYPLNYLFVNPGIYTINFGKDTYFADMQQWVNATDPVYIGYSLIVAPQYPEFELSASNVFPCFGEEVNIYSNYLPQIGTPASTVCWSYSPTGTLGNWPSSNPDPCNALFDDSPLQLMNLLPTDVGPYTVNLSLFNGCNVDKTITIAPHVPQANITQTKLCGYKIQYGITSNCGNIAFDYQWTFPGGTPATSTDANPIVTYPNGGFFQAFVSLSDANGMATSGPFSIWVQPVAITPNYVPPTLDINGISEGELPSECAINNLYSITNFLELSGYSFTLSGVQNGNFVAGGGSSWVINWDNDPNTVSSFTITATSPEGCVSNHTIELQYCCVEPQAYQINGGNISTWLSANGFSNGIISTGNTPLIINGALTIDVNTIFSGCQNVLMGTNSQISIIDGNTLTIAHSEFRACGSDLWKGIISDGPQQTIIAENATFMDAKCAIKLIKNTQYTISGCRFYNNWVGVGYVNMSQQNSIIHQCLFQSTDLMKRAIGASDLFHTIAYQSHFSPYHKGTGIYLVDCENIAIGDPSDIQFRNEFNDLNYGIYAYKAGITAYNNSFQNINSTFYSNSTLNFSCGIFAQSVGSLVRNIVIGATQNNEGNTFHKCSIGLLAYESIAGSVMGNEMSDIQYCGIWWNLSRNSTNIISKNSLNSQLGIGMYVNNNPGCIFNITENQITCDQGSPINFSLTQGISLDGTISGNLANSPGYYVYRNEINNAAIGIAGKSCNRLRIQENRISSYPATLIPASNSNYEIIGILVAACDRPSIIDNLVMGNDQNNVRVKGIEIQESKRPWVQCDSVITCGWAYAFRGSNTGAHITGCKIDDSKFGFVYYNGGFTGAVGAPAQNGEPAVVNGNKWWNIGSAHTLSTSIAGGAITNGTLSPWFLPGQNTNTSENPNPWMVNGFNAGSAISISQANSFVYASAECQEIDYPIYKREQDKNWLYRVADDSAFMAQQNSDTRYWMEEQAYSLLKSQPDLFEYDSVLTSFYTAKELGNSGKFSTIADSLQRNGLLDVEAQVQLNTLRSAILPERLQEINLNTVTEIYLRTHAMGVDSLPIADEQTLHSIAATCYFQGGAAVLMARSMLNSRPNKLPVHYADSCVTQYGMQRLAQTQPAIPSFANSSNVFPNPISMGQPLTISHAKGSFIRIQNTTGQMMLEMTLKSDNEALTLDHRFAAGLYFLQMVSSEGKRTTHKIVLK